ncbi:MAG: hypothetical protein FWG92_03095 [Leptospirales bacterium]|nr:hypothetical protein [Leptospirales bacterium]
MKMSYDTEIEIPFDVFDLDGFNYLIPHGLHISAEPLIKAGIFEMEMANRNVTVSPITGKDAEKKYEAHAKLPATEFLLISGTWDRVVIFSEKLLEILDMDIDTIYKFYSKYDKRLEDVDVSQLSIKNGRLCIGNKATEDMHVVWTGRDFIVTKVSAKLAPEEVAVVWVDGAIAGKKFRCKYGMLDYRAT